MKVNLKKVAIVQKKDLHETASCLHLLIYDAGYGVQLNNGSVQRLGPLAVSFEETAGNDCH